ncbi:MAG: AraC family transcriptional regulator [Spirochaetaceae bacterium]
MIKEQSLYVLPPIPDKRFPIYVEDQKYSNRDEIFRAHWHEHLELLFMKKGEINLICNGQTYIAKQGDLLIINPNDIHHLQSRTSFVNMYCLIFDLSLVRSSLTDPSDLNFIMPLSNNQLVFNHQNIIDNNMDRCIKNLVDIYNKKSETRSLKIKSHIFELLDLIFTNCSYTMLTPTKFKKRNSNVKIIQDLLVYLNQNFNSEINLKELAFNFNVSYHHLCHLFKDYTNSSIIQYVTSLRIDKSIYYLKHTDKTMSEIAMLIGYDDSNYFSRTFKKLMNLSPRDYLKSLE